MDNLNSDLDLLENLSKKISDLIYNNEFSQISFIDAQRRALIKKIIESENKKNAIKSITLGIEKSIVCYINTCDNDSKFCCR